jgi:inorganic pyrophosphatase
MKFKVFIEIPAKSSVKYEIDEQTHLIRVDRFLHTALVYPFNYGFIMDTVGEDGDPLDALVLSPTPVIPGVTIKCRAIGFMEMEDEGGIDNKIICVPDKKLDPELADIEDIKDLSKHSLNKIRHFFEQYKALEPGKWVKVKSFCGRLAAEKEIKKSSK